MSKYTILRRGIIPGVDLLLEPDSHDIVMAFATDLGTMSKDLTAEEACQLGIALIRESGKRHVIRPQVLVQQPPAPLAAQPAEAPAEATQEETDGKANDGDGAGSQPAGGGVHVSLDSAGAEQPAGSGDAPSGVGGETGTG
jgi:hypothetical protein